ncbi:MAG: hypothetical protein ACRDGQ_06445, partial [Candidatus Limnocylindrales bacterium]
MPRSTVRRPIAPIPFDPAADPERPALDELASNLAAVGRRVRNRRSQVLAGQPEPAFADALRHRLLDPAEAPAIAPIAPIAPIESALLDSSVPAAEALSLAERPAEQRGPLSQPRIRAGSTGSPARPIARTGATPARHSPVRVGLSLAIGVVVMALLAVGLAGGRFVATPIDRAGDVSGAILIRAGAGQALSLGTG